LNSSCANYFYLLRFKNLVFVCIFQILIGCSTKVENIWYEIIKHSSDTIYVYIYIWCTWIFNEMNEFVEIYLICMHIYISKIRAMMLGIKRWSEIHRNASLVRNIIPVCWAKRKKSSQTLLIWRDIFADEKSHIQTFAAEYMPCLEINFMRMGKRTRDEGRRKGKKVAEAFDFNSREESCMTWMESGRDQTLEKETLERPAQVWKT